MTRETASNLVPLEFYTNSRVVSGYVSCPNGARLLDILNGTSAAERNLKGDFLEFIDAPHPEEELPRENGKGYVRKSAVQLVGISDSALGRGIGASDGPKLYPFVKKSPVRVNLELQTYTLIGSIHRTQGQTMQDVLNEDSSFLPLTDVTIAREYSVYGTRPFVAVNKQQIISSREEHYG
jgi:hypothetical protein